MEARASVISRGRPVLLIDPRLAADGMLLVDDGRAEWPALEGDLAEVPVEEVGRLARLFAHGAASPSQIGRASCRERV